MSTPVTGTPAQHRSPWLGWGALVVVLVLLGTGIALLRGGGSGPERTITAHFASAPGLFAGNQVDVLGMPVGKVDSVTPHPEGVDVRLRVPADLKLPDQVQVVLMAPNLVSDRYLELYPPYKGGATLADGAEVPVTRTVVPQSADQIIKSVTDLSNALGPQGANANGDLSNLLTATAKAFGPDGTPLKSSVTNFGQALGALGQDGQQLTQLLDSLGQLTTTASQNLQSYQSFSTDLASVSASLAGERNDIATAMHTLQQALTELSTFVTDNAATLAGSVQGLNTFAASLTRQQQALQDTFRTMPLALQNLDAAVDRTSPGGPSLTVRYDPAATSPALAGKACGNPVLRLLTLALARKDGGTYDGKTGDDLICGLNGTVSQLPVPVGAPAPDLMKLLAGAP